MPSRKVVTRSPHRSVGIIACNWLQSEGIEYESLFERKFVFLALVFPYIKQILHQPFSIQYQENGKSHIYTPDFLCKLKDGSQVVVEVKPAVFVEKHRFTLDAAKTQLAAEGIPFLVFTAKETNHKALSANAALILRYTRGAIEPFIEQHVLEVLSGSSPPASMASLLSDAKIQFSDALHLIGRGVIAIPSLDSISDDTPVSLLNKDQENVSFLFRNWLNTSPW